MTLQKLPMCLGIIERRPLLQKISDCCDEKLTWKRNISKIPSGEQGHAFVNELARLFNAFAESTSMEWIGLMAHMVCPSLILQKRILSSREQRPGPLY